MNEVKFTEKDFRDLRKFQNKMNLAFGENAYVGPAYSTVVLEYSPLLMAMIHPMPTDVRYDFVVKMLYCKKCHCSRLFLATPEENEFVCDDCRNKAK